jgi:hypothetical protein
MNQLPTKWNYRRYDTFGEYEHEGVNILLNYILEVLAANNQDNYNYLLKWLANMIKGNKNNSCLYLRGTQGAGKSTLFQFIRKYVIGKELCVETGSEAIRSNFNGILAGKLLVILEELETFSTNEWMAVSSRLNRYISSDTITIETNYEDAYQAQNMNNFVILSNTDAIIDGCARRYFILDLSTTRINDNQYWSNIYDNCFNDEVGEAFYCYLMEIDTTGFN